MLTSNTVSPKGSCSATLVKRPCVPRGSRPKPLLQDSHNIIHNMMGCCAVAPNSQPQKPMMSMLTSITVNPNGSCNATLVKQPRVARGSR